MRRNAGPESVRWISIGARKAEFDFTDSFEGQNDQIWEKLCRQLIEEKIDLIRTEIVEMLMADCCQA